MRIAVFGVDQSGARSPFNQGAVGHQTLQNRIRLGLGLLEIVPLGSRNRPERYVSVMGLLLGPRGSRSYERRDRQRADDPQDSEVFLHHAVPSDCEMPAACGDKIRWIAGSALLPELTAIRPI